jgi:hypothetical protein
MNAHLHTWKLTPTATPSALWYLSSVRSPVRVRAPGPFEARELATQRFCRMESTRPPVASSPWLDPDLVICIEDHDERLAELAEPGIVSD